MRKLVIVLSLFVVWVVSAQFADIWVDNNADGSNNIDVLDANVNSSEDWVKVQDFVWTEVDTSNGTTVNTDVVNIKTNDSYGIVTPNTVEETPTNLTVDGSQESNKHNSAYTTMWNVKTGVSDNLLLLVIMVSFIVAWYLSFANRK